ncbi:MAG: sensor histidine kinase, partial [Chthoniobacterales bacterium]
MSWCTVQAETNPHYSEWWVANAAVARFLSFGVVVAATSAIKSQRKIDRARIATAERAQQLERQLLEIADREKDRLGRELHDGLCQNLAGIAALSATLGRQLAPHNQPAAEAAAEINRLLCGTMTEARNLAHGLNPVELNGSGLIAALKTLAHNTEVLFSLSCTFRCNRFSSALGAEVERHLYRIIQEAVRNAVSHGRPSDISISLRFAKNKGVLIIRDNGPGFAASASHGHGLETMKYRAALIGAPLLVRPDSRRGT